MDRLDTLRVFIAVAEESGFAAAARRLALSPPAVTRAISALEERIGTRLLHRTTRTVRLTEAGRRFLTDCKRILGELEEAEASAAGSQTELRGLLTVTASMMFGRLYVAPLVLDFLARHPQVVSRMLLLDRVVDLVDEGIDVAVRIAHLQDSSLNAIRVGAVRRVVCASPRYLAEHGRPRTPAELSRFEAIVFSQGASQQGWSFMSGSKVQTVTPPSRLSVNTADVGIEAAVAGRGLAAALSYQIASQLRRGQLELVLEDFEPPPIPIHVVHPEGRRANARVRAFVDFAVEWLRAQESLSVRE